MVLEPPEFVISLFRREADPHCPVQIWSGEFRVPPAPLRPYPILQVKSSPISGKGWSEAEARASCIGEAVERRSAMFRGDEPRCAARYSDLGGSAISPAEFLQYSPRQYFGRAAWNAAFGANHYVPGPWQDNDSLEWTPCESLTGGSRLLVPAGACYLRYAPPEARILFPNESTGFAAAPDRAEAIVRAFLEVVERDALALWWYNRCDRPAVDLGAFGDERLERAAEYLSRNGRTLHALDLTTDFGIPVVAAVSATLEGDAILFGFAADFSFVTASHRAVAELFQIMGPSKLWSRKAMLEECELQLDRKVWISAATLENQPFVLPAADSVRTPSICDARPGDSITVRLEECLRCARRAGMQVLVCDMTRDDTRIPVAKVLIPGMRSSWVHLGPGRLYDIPARLGWLKSPKAEPDMNPLPFFL